MRPSNSGGIEEDIPEHIRAIQQKVAGKTSDEKAEIQWDYWHFIAVFLFRFSEEEFFEKTTLRRLFSLCEQYQKFHNKQD